MVKARWLAADRRSRILCWRRRRHSCVRSGGGVVVLGTAAGLESDLVPAAGFPGGDS